MKNTQAIVLQGMVRVSEDMKPYMVVDDIRYLLPGNLSLRTGDCIHVIGRIVAIEGGRVVIEGAMKYLETVDSREE